MVDAKVYYLNKGTRIVDEAEKEASEVLHSLLSVERIEKPDSLKNIQHQVVVFSSNGEEIQWDDSELQHHGNVFMLDNSQTEYSQQGNTVLWDNALSLDVNSTPQPDHMVVPAILVNDNTFAQENQRMSKNPGSNKRTVKKSNHKWQFKKPKKLVNSGTSSPAKVQLNEVDVEMDNANDVKQRFRQGCECQDISCFHGLNPDCVYRHRLNIAELTKEEHDMYLMGVTMACMSDPSMTVKQRERRRLRAQYVYHGRRVCLSAFLYLENCTLYQLKRIRKHVMTHGVTPRVHGNHGKKPHNVFSLETYRRATNFLKLYIDQHNTTTGNCKTTVMFPPEISRKSIHNAYKEHMKLSAPPDEKTMGYSTFRHFMKEQFPHVRFCKVELGTQNASSFTNSSSKQQYTNNHSVNSTTCNTDRATNTEECHGHTLVTSAPVQTLSTIPLLLQEQSKPEMAQTAYIVTPVSQLVPAGHTIAVHTTPLANYAFAM